MTRQRRSPIEALRSAVALLLIRLANRIYGNWFFYMNRTEQQWSWTLNDPYHDYAPEQIEERAKYLVEGIRKTIHFDQLMGWWVTQQYERHEKNPVKNIRLLFKGITLSPFDASFSIDTFKGPYYSDIDFRRHE